MIPPSLDFLFGDSRNLFHQQVSHIEKSDSQFVGPVPFGASNSLLASSCFLSLYQTFIRDEPCTRHSKHLREPGFRFPPNHLLCGTNRLLFVTENHSSRMLFALLIFLSLLLYFFFLEPSCLGWHFICQCDVLRGSDTGCFEQCRKMRLLVQLCLLLVCHKCCHKYAQRVRSLLRIQGRTEKPQIQSHAQLVDNTTTDNGRFHHLQQSSSLLDNSKCLVAEALPQLARCTRSRCANLTTSTVSSRNRDKSATCSTVRCCTRSCLSLFEGTNLITSMWSQPAQRQRIIHSLRRDSVLMCKCRNFLHDRRNRDIQSLRRDS